MWTKRCRPHTKAINKQQAVVLVLLDLPAAFDTVDHGIMCCRLERLLGLLLKMLCPNYVLAVCADTHHDGLSAVVHVFITQQLEYCSFLFLSALANQLITNLQWIQSITVRNITGCWKHDDITPVFKELHWLPANRWIQFKTLVLTYKSLNHQALA